MFSIARRTKAFGKVVRAVVCSSKISLPTVTWSSVLLSLSPKCIITRRTFGEMGVLCLSRCMALATLAPGKQSTCTRRSWMRGSRLILEAPRIRVGLVGVRNQLRYLFP